MQQFIANVGLALFLALIISYVWARFKFFKVSTKFSRASTYIYDPVVAVQIATTIYHFLTYRPLPIDCYLAAVAAYLLSLSTFWWVILSNDQLNFAFEKNVGKLITSGPFSIVRHPLYFSYIVTWSTGTLLFHSSLLLITLAFLVYFYVIAAFQEEGLMINSLRGNEYTKYRRNVGMFIPKATQWKKWISGLFRIQTR